jgi:AcrR family transcriptional regulator
MEHGLSSPESNPPVESESKLAAQAARTRARLIEATLELLPKYGFKKLSLDQIAAHVGMTKGAIYGSFANKDALILTAIGSRQESRPDKLAWPQERVGSAKARMRRLAETILASESAAGSGRAASAEFLTYALGNPQMRARIAPLAALGYAQMEANILGLFDPEELAMPVRSLAILLSATIPGLSFNRALAPDAIPDDAVIAMFEGFASA